MSDAAPRWFRAALAEVPEHRETRVDGCRIHLRCWGEQGRPGLVLVHGGSANSGWWDHIAPLFAREYRVVAPDMSGHGDSDWRDSYGGHKEWAREVLAAVEAGGIDGRVSVIGHSMGGWITATVGVLAGEQLNGIVIIDSPLNDQPPEEERLRQRRRPTKIYPDREAIIARFTALPVQDVLLPYVREHIAEESIRPVAGGWTWKFDPSMFGRNRLLMRELLPDVRCRVGYLRSEFGLVSPEMAADISELLGHRAIIAELPDAGHHPMLDQPLPLVTALRTLLAGWALEDRKTRL
ncbi:MAG TPA: alpha/beta hydrolase [Amycolatopsis sp.]|nr:alpha/beta hydrolase [Amycolatopsis sp.]